MKTASIPVVAVDDDIESLEHERLFGSDVDLFCNLNKCRILERIAQKEPLQNIYDDDVWDTFSTFIKQSEIRTLIDNLIKGKVQQRRFISQSCHSTSFDNIMGALYQEVSYRKRIWRFLKEIMNKRIEEYTLAMSDNSHAVSIFQRRIEELQSMLKLNEHETRILTVLFFQQSNMLDLGDFSPQSFGNKTQFIKKLSVVTGLTEQQILDCFEQNAPIHMYNLLDDDLDITNMFMDFLFGTNNQPLIERMWNRYEGDALSMDCYSENIRKQGKTIMEMIESKSPDTGLSILLYGEPGTGKTNIAISLGRSLGKDVYFIAQSINSESNSATRYSANFRYAALTSARQQLPPDKCILVVDECDDMIESLESFGLFGLYNMKNSGEAKGQLNNVLDMNRHTIIWICNSHQDSISISSRRRFDYSMHFDSLPPESRVHIWENCLKKYGCEKSLTPDHIAMLAKTFNVNAGGISNAVKNASAICKKYPQKDFSSYLMEFLNVHCELMNINQSENAHKEPARDYTLDGLNIHSNLTPQQLLDACRNFLNVQSNHVQNDRDCPRMNILLHGVPGSGKTEFVKYAACTLHMKLKIMTAADLLNAYVGETEKSIVQAFANAQKNHEILFFDEGDSLLYPRNMADRSWEISQVNTLLAEMEKFNGIFIISTNFIQRLDSAVLRRFTFRLHFDYLENDGKLKFFNTYFKHMNLPALTAKETDKLYSIPRLTPSDFRNVRQQFFYLSESDLTNAKLIDMLMQETNSRDSQGNYKNLGETKHVIGFDTP